jgi:hypothetical protein
MWSGTYVLQEKMTGYGQQTKLLVEFVLGQQLWFSVGVPH